MSNSDNDHNGRNSQAEMPYELRLGLDEIEQTDPLAARVITYAWHSQDIDLDASPVEDASFEQQAQNTRNAAESLNRQDQEANRSDSEPEPESQDLRVRGTAGLSHRERHRIRVALAQSHVDDSTRDISTLR